MARRIRVLDNPQGTNLEGLLPIGLVAVGGYLLLIQGKTGTTGGGSTGDGNNTTRRPPTLAETHTGHYVSSFDYDASRNIYKVENGLKRRFPDWESYLVDGGAADRSNVFPVSAADLRQIADGPNMPVRRFVWRNDGSFVKGTGPTIWRMEGGRKRRIPDWQTFLAIGGRSNLSNVYVIGDEWIRSIPDGTPILSLRGNTYYVGF